MRNLCHSRPKTHAFPTCAAHFSAFLIRLSCRLCPIRPYGAPSPRGEGFVRRYSFSTYACICSDDMGIALFSQTRHLRRSSRSFSSRFPIQPPPLRGTSFHRKEGMTTRAPSLGRGCRAQRGGVGFLFYGQAASSLPSPLGKALCREKRYPRIAAFPIGEGGPRQRWIGCSRISST